MEQSAWPDVFPDSSRQRLTSHQSTDALSFKPTSRRARYRQQYKESAIVVVVVATRDARVGSHRRLL
jgi:hypothetical protein